jgi:hypothetical protein
MRGAFAYACACAFAFAFAFAGIGIAAEGEAWAHKPSDSYLVLGVDGSEVKGRWDVALRDLDHAIGIDGDANGEITWGEVRTRHDAIARYATERLAVRADGAACVIEAGDQRIADHTDGAYTAIELAARCPGVPRDLGVTYALFFDVDPQHRGLLRVDARGRTHTEILRAGDASRTIELGEAPSRGATALAFVVEGARHIWIGLDHILFLIALLLPSVLARRDGRWQAQARLRPVVTGVLKVVTAFTIAHSITLALAVTGVVRLPSRFVETAIAASVVLAALNNLVPLVDARWGVAFLLGLLHGFGFSSVLVDLGLPATDLALGLLSFNLGVELGQAAIVAAFLPIAFLLRASWAYRRLTLVGGSLAIAALALMWSVERLGG